MRMEERSKFATQFFLLHPNPSCSSDTTADGTCDEKHNGGGQVYARHYEFAGPATSEKPVGIAIMYAWYFPWRGGKRHDWQQVIVWLSSKSSAEAQILKISYSNPDGYHTVLQQSLSLQDKSTPLVEALEGAVEPTTKVGNKQPLVVWYSLPQLAWKKLMSDDNFDGNRCPLADAQFDKHIMAACRSSGASCT